MTSDTPLSASEAAAIARRAIPLLDLTNLDDACEVSDVEALCETARAHPVAAICVWPRFVADAARALRDSNLPIAAVVNFPEGSDAIAEQVEQARRAIGEGAQEVDLVMPYRAFLRGEHELAHDMIAAVKDACAPLILLKVILESGVYPGQEAVGAASRLALGAGADFLKTSTGKSAVSATPETAETMLITIRDRSGARPAGFKVSGGLRTVEDAGRYLALADAIMGPDWVAPSRFRIGASSLLGNLEGALRSAS